MIRAKATRRVRGWSLAILAYAGLIPFANAQFVTGDWVERGEASIREHRQTDVALLVFDAEGKLAVDAQVRIEQLRHAFTLGFAVHDAFPTAFDRDAEGWRVFNAVSLAPLTSWRQVQPTGPDSMSTEPIDQAIETAKAARLAVHWGPLISADTFDLPEWAVPLRGQALADAARSYTQKIAAAYAHVVREADTAEKTLGHDRFPPAALRLLALDLDTAWPTATPSLRYAGALAGRQNFDVVQAIDAVLTQQLATERFTVEQVFGPQAIIQDRLEPALKRLTRYQRPLTVGSLEIGSSQAIESTVNTETVLRTLFAEPMVDGVFFAGLTADQYVEPSAALVNDDGDITPVLRTADRLFRQTWWTDTTVQTNHLGRASARVFLGEHRVTATLADGSQVSVDIRLDEPDAPPRQLILMPVSASTASGPTP